MPEIFKFEQTGFIVSPEPILIPDVEVDTEGGIEYMPDGETPVEQQPESDYEDEDSAVEDELSEYEREESDEYEGEPAENEAYGALQEEPSLLAAPQIQPVAMTREQLEETFANELEQIKGEAREEAFYAAVRQKKAEIDETINEVNSSVNEMLELQKRYFSQFADELKYFAIEIAEKIINERIESDDTALEKLVLATVNSAKSGGWMKVEVSEHLSGLVEALRKELAHTDDDIHYEVTPKALADDTVRVTTESGTVDASVSTQLRNLREVFENADALEERR